MPRAGKFRERTLRSFPRTMTYSALRPLSLLALIGMGVKPKVFPLADRTRATCASESMLIVYTPAGRTVLPQWTSNGKVNLAAMVSAFAAAANAKVASRTTANSFTCIACRIVLAFIVILLIHWPTRFCCPGGGGRIVPSLYKAKTKGNLAHRI